MSAPLLCVPLTDEPHTITWPDGSTATLYPVHTNRAPSGACLRAVQQPGGAWLVFDLYRALPELRWDLPHAPLRDQRGVTFYALRLGFENAADFVASAAACALPVLQFDTGAELVVV